jgi:glycosyltransferase involved in cell wall biosynthesis
LQENQFMHSGVLIRKSALDKVWLYNPKFIIGQDYELWCRIWLEYKMRIIPDIAIIYRFHHNSISSTKKKSSITISSPAFWINKNNYPHFYRALILRFWAFILPKSFRVYVKKFFFPNLHMWSNNWECNKKNILVLNYEFPPIGGGAAPISYDICKWYVDKWFNVDVITMGFKNLPVYENKDWINIHRVKCVRLKKEICYPFEQLTYLISWYFKAKQLLKQTKYDICHCHFLVPTGILALILKKRFWIKYFVTAHGSDVPWYNPNRFKILHKFTPRLLKQIINNSEIVISPSKYLAELIRKNIKWFKKDIEVIPNWIDSNTYIPQKKEKIIVWTWRLWPVKWLHLLANAFSQIEDTQWFELHILGDWPLMAQLKEIQNKSKNEIILHWWVDNKSKEYLDTLWKSMIFCLPSISENSPISILEWMSSWCSILTTASTWCLEMSKWVWIYISPTVESIKKQLEYLIKNNNICKEYWEKARQKILTTYKKELIIWKYIEICNKYI